MPSTCDNVHLATLHTTLQAEHLTAGSDNEVRDQFLQRRRLLRRAMAEILFTGAAHDELDDRLDPDATPAEILAFQEDALILWRLDPDGIDLRTLYENYLRRLRPRPAPNDMSPATRGHQRDLAETLKGVYGGVQLRSGSRFA